jgi:DNA-binding PadR family transcriptional regulator
LRVLHYASQQPVFGLFLIEKLAGQGHRVSPGTLYPLLHSLEESSLLESHSELHRGKIRRYYRITAHGRRHLKKSKTQMIELARELLTSEDIGVYVPQ